MIGRTFLTLAAVGLLAGILAGCQSPARTTSTDKGKTSSHAELDEESRIQAAARFAAGMAHQLRNESDAALEQYAESVKVDPHHEDLVLEVSRLYLQRNEPKKALEVLDKASRLPNVAPDVFSYQGIAYSQTGETNKAIASFRKALSLSSKKLPAYLNLSRIYQESGRPKEARQILLEAAAQKDVEGGFLVDLAEQFGNLARSQGDDMEGYKAQKLQILDRAYALEPKAEDIRIVQKLADEYQGLGELTKAATLYERLVQRYPSIWVLRERLIDIYLRAERGEDAAKQLELIAQENPTNPRAYYFLGGIAYERKDFKRAEEYYERSLLLNPDFGPVYFDLAGVKLALDRPADALTVLGKARVMFKPSFLLEFYTAVAFVESKGYAEAIKHYNAAEVIGNATETNRLNHAFYFQFGAALERNGQHEEAVKYFRKSLALKADFPDALNYLGYMWAERGENLDEAKKMIEQALKLEPESAAYLDSMGWVLHRLNRHSDALKYLLLAIEKSTTPDSTLYDHLGDVYAALNQLDKARTAWKRSLELEPNETIEKKLKGTPTAQGPR